MMFLRIIINNIKNVRYIEALQALYTRTAFFLRIICKYIMYTHRRLVNILHMCVFLIRNGVPR